MRCKLIFLALFFSLAANLIFSQIKSHNDFRQTGSTITGKNVRFQFLTHSLVRMEYSAADKFIDAPTAVVSNRNWRQIRVISEEKNGWLIAHTQRLTLRYRLGTGRFSKNNLEVIWNNPNGEKSWSPGDTDTLNLGGLSHSLDGIRKNRLPSFTPGLLSRSGYYFLDDSQSPVWDNSTSWIVPRDLQDDQDWYLFVYGQDYSRVLKEYSELYGKIPMPPKYILGSWITDLNYEYLPNSDLVKNYNYTDQNIKDEIMKFRDNGIPLDIMVLDFAWHKYGWKGSYDWSPIFPHPKEFLDWAHNNGIKISLNDHPGYGNESVLSEKDSHAQEIKKLLNINVPQAPKIKLDIHKDWEILFDPKNIGGKEKWYLPSFDNSGWKTIQTGKAWEEQGYPNYDGYAWYRKSVMIPKALFSDSLFLIFGGVDDSYDLYINGQKAAHFGEKGKSVYNSTTYTEISKFIRPGGKNLIVLRVFDWGGYGGISGEPVEIADKIPFGGIRFNLAIKKDAEVFMNVLHNPLIKEGVDFWWIDGGSGSCDMQGLNSQMWTNRVFYDLTQKFTNKRTFVFSRFGGWGNNRYPGMFTGDTYSQWEVLNYEVPFTTKGGNVLMPYITHDIGGFLGKKIDFNLYARWIEFGALSPILRLHSAYENPENGNLRMPWNYGKEGIELVKKFFRLRYKLIPYIYTYCRIAYDEALPLVKPLYLEYPALNKAYNFPGEYFFGKEILVAPVTNEDNEADIYLPPGDWYNYFTGEKYSGDQEIHKQFKLDDIPMFVKAGSIIPTMPVRQYTDQGPLDTLIINIFGETEGNFDLYNDDGNSLDYISDKFAWTNISLSKSTEGKTLIIIGPTRGDYAGQVAERVYELKLHDFTKPSAIELNGNSLPEISGTNEYWNWNAKSSTVNIFLKPRNIREGIKISLK